MFITKKILKKKGACKEGIRLFIKIFPKGTDHKNILKTIDENKYNYWWKIWLIESFRLSTKVNYIDKEDNLKYERTFKKGKQIKFIGYYKNGNKFFEENYIKEEEPIKSITYFKNEKIKSIANYNNNMRNKKYIEWDKNGKIKLNKTYKDSLLIKGKGKLKKSDKIILKLNKILKNTPFNGNTKSLKALYTQTKSYKETLIEIILFYKKYKSFDKKYIKAFTLYHLNNKLNGNSGYHPLKVLISSRIETLEKWNNAYKIIKNNI